MLKIMKKMNLLLDAKQKRTMVGIVIMMLVGGVLESLGVTMLVPIITVVVDPVKVEENRYLSAVYHGLHLQNTAQFAVVMLLAFVGIIVIKNLYLFCQQKVRNLAQDDDQLYGKAV